MLSAAKPLDSGAVSPRAVRRTSSAAAMADEERDGLLAEAPASPSSAAATPSTPGAGLSWRVYRTVALLALTTMFLFADQNLMVRPRAPGAAERRAGVR